MPFQSKHIVAIAKFHFFLWPSSIPLYICIPVSFFPFKNTSGIELGPALLQYNLILCLQKSSFLGHILGTGGLQLGCIAEMLTFPEEGPLTTPVIVASFLVVSLFLGKEAE